MKYGDIHWPHDFITNWKDFIESEILDHIDRQAFMYDDEPDFLSDEIDDTPVRRVEEQESTSDEDITDSLLRMGIVSDGQSEPAVVTGTMIDGSIIMDSSISTNTLISAPTVTMSDEIIREVTERVEQQIMDRLFYVIDDIITDRLQYVIEEYIQRGGRFDR